MRLERDDDEGAAILRPLDEQRARHELARSAHFVKLKRKDFVTVAPPMNVVRDLLALASLPLPVLTRIVEVPTFTRRGDLIVTPGFHPASGIYFDNRGKLTIPPIPREPSDQQMYDARDFLLNDLLGDFPFVSDADRAHAVCLPLEPIVRDMIEGPCPNHLIDAPAAGTGKTLLADTLLRTVSGLVGVMTETQNDDEWRKRFTAMFREGRAIVLIDNVRHPLTSGAISTALTLTEWEDRLLGLNETIIVPVRCTWVTTGNNVRMSDEIARRTIPTRIDAKMDRPFERDPEKFRHPNLRTWASTNRGHIIGALLVLAQVWITRGRPAPKVRPLGSFESWSVVVGGILECAGIKGFLGNISELYDRADDDGRRWRLFVETWWEKFADQEMKVAELLPIATELDLALGRAEKDHARSITLGKRLAARRDQVLGEYQITQSGTSRRAVLWRLSKVSRHV